LTHMIYHHIHRVGGEYILRFSADNNVIGGKNRSSTIF